MMKLNTKNLRRLAIGVLINIMVRHKKGHKNSKGETAEWVIVSHKDGHIISSHKTKAEAKKHLTDIRKFKHMGESMNLEQAKNILNEAGFKYVDTEKELKRKEKFTKDLTEYSNALNDIKTSIKITKEGLSQTLTDDMEDYVVNETRFILKMARKLVKLLENDLYKTIEED